jgi:hypothetical protein
VRTAGILYLADPMALNGSDLIDCHHSMELLAVSYANEGYSG